MPMGAVMNLEGDSGRLLFQYPNQLSAGLLEMNGLLGEMLQRNHEQSPQKVTMEKAVEVMWREQRLRDLERQYARIMAFELPTKILNALDDYMVSRILSRKHLHDMHTVNVDSFRILRDIVSSPQVTPISRRHVLEKVWMSDEVVPYHQVYALLEEEKRQAMAFADRHPDVPRGTYPSCEQFFDYAQTKGISKALARSLSSAKPAL
ncbi:hypothetical protein R3P38DRAFT_1554290 [Favolaschia claudopus]|uniref:Uncharacterized protein n=1 Tax=Favolaschia claudopus TaxID=2862362 RepID=A0AAW0AL79_9AGAR